MKMVRQLTYSVAVGIHFQADVQQLQNTLLSLVTNTDMAVKIILLADGAGPLPNSVTTNERLTIAATVDLQGAAACFNRLCSLTQTDVVVFLESGCQVAPDWLNYLLAAMMAKPNHGLAGPSTNMAWNEQGIFPERTAESQNLQKVSEKLLKRFGATWQSLAPLYSLADFCYAIRREVIDVVGATDENYGLGPCWEMDYNIRAARAGFSGVWARAAYVHRAPFNPIRARHEPILLETNKRYYQQKFCARHHQSNQASYCAHCRGEDCPNFAPADLIQIKMKPSTTNLSIDVNKLSLAQSTPPLVTCIMPTADRREYIPQAVRNFQYQDYPNLELLVIDDGNDLIRDCLPNDERIRYIHIENKLNLGRKRNLACSEAKGDIIVHWDDDDWYPPDRVSRQVEALLQHCAEVCGSSRLYYQESHSRRAWEYRFPNQQWVAGNTLVYRRAFWQSHPFPDIHKGEDNLFVRQANKQSLVDLRDPRLCIASIHPTNTSHKVPSGSLWLPIAYTRLKEIQQQAELSIINKSIAIQPKVSCILPTYNRHQFIPLTLDNYYAQSYPNKELIIVDDSSHSIAELVRGLSDVQLVSLTQHTSIGRKRNIACDHASGDIIAHWDDDDWYGPDRLQRQVQPILENYADITGLENRYVLDLSNGEFWTVDPILHRRMFVGDVHGGTLVFRKSIWDSGIHYPEVNLAEDAAFLKTSLQRGARLTRIANSGCFVYVRHGNNAWAFDSGRFLEPSGWSRTTAPSGFNATVQNRYQSVAG